MKDTKRCCPNCQCDRCITKTTQCYPNCQCNRCINSSNNGLVLTLKQLLKLGVINPKRKRKRRNTKAADEYPSPKPGQTGYPYIFQPNQMQPYTDNLRIRDEQANLNTCRLEYRN